MPGAGQATLVALWQGRLGAWSDGCSWTSHWSWTSHCSGLLARREGCALFTQLMTLLRQPSL